MAPTPAHLRAAADGLRRTAHRLAVDLGPLAAHGDHQTWEGPAATAYRRAATDAQARGARAGEGLRGLAARLDGRADEVERAAAAEAEQEARARERRRREHGLGPRRVADARDRRRPGWVRPGVDAAFPVTGGGDRG